ncbi:MAG: DedA family protein [Succinivibrionaceae bacterium]|jgi:membrane protein YqaA with SNARE-associated domain|nr:DedA family protein [Succinivibrionaceae bacterium]MBQ8976786.1 DedA family protein [Succinivibrionaceae bacterium]
MEAKAEYQTEKKSIIKACYDYCLKLSKHRYAKFFMCVNSFIESIFWPLPVEAILIPMCLAQPKKSLGFAFYATIFSVLGAWVGYLLGYYLWDVLQPIFVKLGYLHHVETIKEWFESFGILFVALGAFTPIPYKVIAITTGVIAASHGIDMWGFSSQISIYTFLIVSLFGRGARFYLEGGLIKIFGEKMRDNIGKYIDWIGWGCIALAVIGIVVYKFH